MEHYKVEPYVVCADVYGAPPHTGRGGWTWYTGSASWLYRVALEAILGFHLEGDTLRLDPCIPRGWPGFEITYRHRSATYRVRVDNPAGTGRGVRSVTLDGRPVPGGDGAAARRRASARGPRGRWADGRAGIAAMADTPLSDDDDLYRLPTDKELSRLQRTTVLYYLHETNPDNGLVRDKTDPDAPVQHRRRRHGPGDDPGRRRARRRHPQVRGEDRPPPAPHTCSTCPQGPEPDAAGYKGFFYHFLDIETGRRVWECELSTHRLGVPVRGRAHLSPPTSTRDTADEAEVRRLADALYRRADWNWACDGGPTLTHGWRPETGFIPHR